MKLVVRKIEQSREFPFISNRDYVSLINDVSVLKRYGYSYGMSGDWLRDNYRYLKYSVINSVLKKCYMNREIIKSNNDRVSC